MQELHLVNKIDHFEVEILFAKRVSTNLHASRNPPFMGPIKQQVVVMVMAAIKAGMAAW